MADRARERTKNVVYSLGRILKRLIWVVVVSIPLANALQWESLYDSERKESFVSRRPIAASSRFTESRNGANDALDFRSQIAGGEAGFLIPFYSYTKYSYQHHHITTPPVFINLSTCIHPRSLDSLVLSLCTPGSHAELLDDCFHRQEHMDQVRLAYNVNRCWCQGRWALSLTGQITSHIAPVYLAGIFCKSGILTHDRYSNFSSQWTSGFCSLQRAPIF